MSEINVDVVLPSQVTTDVFSPSLQGEANVFIPGTQGPPGPVNHFKTIKVDGQSDLIPIGIESLKFIGQTGINILTDDSQNPKSITINAAPLSGYFEAENVIGYKASLAPGSDSYTINFPQQLAYTPKAVTCAFQNVVDDMAYYFSIGNIDVNGFNINFSDVLLNNGYFLNIQVKK
jgi:hypothetical protein